eukprot:215083-Amphidinium_carterae.1
MRLASHAGTDVPDVSEGSGLPAQAGADEGPESAVEAAAAASTDSDFLDDFHDEPRHDGPVATSARGARIDPTIKGGTRLACFDALPFQPWCSICVRSRSKADQHRCRDPQAHEYEVNLTIDSVYGRSLALVCSRKGGQDKYAVASLRNYIPSLGDTIARSNTVASKGSNVNIERLHAWNIRSTHSHIAVGSM